MEIRNAAVEETQAAYHHGMLLVFAVCIGIFLGSPASAAEVPHQLRNKTITLSWTSTGTYKNSSGAIRGFNNGHTKTIYISGLGHLFERRKINNNYHQRSEDVEARNGKLGFTGNRLIGVDVFENGARQYVVTFDGTFSRCTLTVITGKAGSRAIRQAGPSGAITDGYDIRAVAPTCSVQDGNAFGSY